MFKSIEVFFGRLLGFEKYFPELEGNYFIWKPENISVELLSDNTYLKIGKFIELNQQLDDGEYGWTQSRLNIPGTWHVQSATVVGVSIEINVKDRGTFIISENNFGALSFDILDSDADNDDVLLNTIWERHALRR